MIWSVSSDRQFRVCQRQWYFSKVVAHHAANDPVRQQAYLLSKLQGLAAWRGNLVDHVLSVKVIRQLGRKSLPSFNETLSFARKIFDQQVAFAQAHRLREPNMSPSKQPEVFAAWHAVEYGDIVTNESIERCWSEIELAITNLYAMPELLAVLSSAVKCITQRPLSFEMHGISVKAQPDVIVFRKRQVPMIIDWKTYNKDNYDHVRQLACYAIALTKCQPHRDFPYSLAHLEATDIDLLEVQLLTNKQRSYRLTQADCLAIENFIVHSAFNMEAAVDELPRKTIDPTQFPPAHSPRTCHYCPFKALCWEEECR